MEILGTIGNGFAALILALVALWVLSLVIELVYRVWFEMVLGRFRIGTDQGADDHVEAANAILGRKKKVTYSTYLTREEMSAVAKEVDRRRDEELCRVANEVFGEKRKFTSAAQLTREEREQVYAEMRRRDEAGREERIRAWRASRNGR